MPFLNSIARVALAGASLVAGLAFTTSAALADTDVILCNKTGAKVFVALGYYEPKTSKWILSAWHTRDGGACTSAGKYRSGLIYYYAEKEGGKYHWPAQAKVDKQFCVPPGKIERTIMGGTCATGERNLGFTGTDAKGASHTINFSN